MPKLKITKTFPFAHRGCDVVEYQAGTVIETDDQELIDTVLAEKWGHRPRQRNAGQPDGDADDADDASATTTPADTGDTPESPAA